MSLQKQLAICFLLFVSFNCLAMSERPVDVSGVAGTLYYTEDKLAQPVIAVWGGSDGGDFVRKYPTVMASVRELVKYGYAVLSITYFDPTGISKNIPRELKRLPLEYFERAFNWVQKQPDLKGNTLAVYGMSRGAELALLLASKYDIIDVVVAGVPSSYVWGSYDMFRSHEEWSIILQTDPCQAAWTWKGQDIPNICHNYQLDYNPWHKIIENTKLVNDYAIPVEKGTAAVLLTSGIYDEVWPSKQMSERIISRLESNKYTYPYKHMSYGTGHNVYSNSWRDVFSFIKSHYPIN